MEQFAQSHLTSVLILMLLPSGFIIVNMEILNGKYDVTYIKLLLPRFLTKVLVGAGEVLLF